ncbi:MAG: gliding motility protein GldM [Bacteroidales bacterium]|nr:gliding motility protein GldM [Bacteroidales bacterium]
MSGAKETPRQKMIGMMYLVYTALLAMNVSKDILDAFDTVNAGVQETNITLMQQISQRYATFEEQYTMDQEKVGPYWQEAQKLRDKSTEMINYLEAMKWDLVSKIEEMDYADALEHGLLKSSDTIQYNGRLLYNINTSKIKSRDNYNKPTAYMMGDPEGNGRAFELKEKIDEYRREIVRIMGVEHIHELGLITDTQYSEGDSIGTKIDYAPDASDALQKSWEYRNFHHTVLIADVTLLNKIISEVETAELNAVTHLAQAIHAEDFTFDEIGAKVFAESSYILSGQKYRAQAMVTAWQNSQTTARVSLDGGPEKEYASNTQGVIDLEYNVGVGTHRYTGVIQMRNPKTNEMEDYTFENTFTVAPPAVSVSATKMNVVYAGIDNPIAIGGGVGGEISATASGANLTRTGNGTYNLRVVGNPTEVTVNVSSQGSNLGSMKFRVKELPKPNAKIDNVGVDGKVSKSALLAANMVRAEMKDFDFDGVHYDVVGYTVKYRTKAGTVKEEKVNGSKFSETLKSVFNSANVGDIFVFTAIRVKGNDNKEKVLDSQIAVEIK